MLSTNSFISNSLELNLFFLRIMKEHLYFIGLSFTPKNENLAKQAESLRREFEGILAETIMLSNGIISDQVLLSGELITEYTLKAEIATSFFTGVRIDTKLTQDEANLKPGSIVEENRRLDRRVHMLNQRIITAMTALVNFKKALLTNVLSCKIFINLYPTMLEHLVHEAEYYMKMLTGLQERKEMDALKETTMQELFWDDIMAEHARFIRGLLDPSENELINIANNFGYKFDQLQEAAKTSTDQNLPLLKTLEEFRDFKATATKGVLECKIKLMAPPLLADHVLREANYYLRILKLLS